MPNSQNENLRNELLAQYRLANEVIRFQIYTRIMSQLDAMDAALRVIEQRDRDFYEFQAKGFNAQEAANYISRGIAPPRF